MLAIERMRIIKKYILEHQQAEVNALSGLLNVSEVTVRRDLEKLEKTGFLERTHGGAMLAESRMPEADEQANINNLDNAGLADASSDMRGIAFCAANLVEDGNTLLLLSGLLTRLLAIELKRKNNLRILTNDFFSAMELGRNRSNNVFFLGGELDSTENAVFGDTTLTDLRRFHVDLFFTQVDGLSEDLSLSVGLKQKAAFISEGRNICKNFVVLCDKIAFGKRAFYQFGKITEGDTLVANKWMPEESKELIFSSNIRLFTAIDVFEGTT